MNVIVLGSVALCQLFINPYCLIYKLNILIILYCCIIMCYWMWMIFLIVLGEQKLGLSLENTPQIKQNIISYIQNHIQGDYIISQGRKVACWIVSTLLQMCNNYSLSPSCCNFAMELILWIISRMNWQLPWKKLVKVHFTIVMFLYTKIMTVTIPSHLSFSHWVVFFFKKILEQIKVFFSILCISYTI